jgi:hypothetical protein
MLWQSRRLQTQQNLSKTQFEAADLCRLCVTMCRFGRSQISLTASERSVTTFLGASVQQVLPSQRQGHHSALNLSGAASASEGLLAASR